MGKAAAHAAHGTPRRLPGGPPRPPHPGGRRREQHIYFVHAPTQRSAVSGRPSCQQTRISTGFKGKKKKKEQKSRVICGEGARERFVEGPKDGGLGRRPRPAGSGGEFGRSAGGRVERRLLPGSTARYLSARAPSVLNYDLKAWLAPAGEAELTAPEPRCPPAALPLAAAAACVFAER